MMEHLKHLIAFGGILFLSGLVLTILTWPYALAVVEVDMAYPIASGIIFIGIFTGQLMSIIATFMCFRGIEAFTCEVAFGKMFLLFLIVIFYLVIWFSCGAGQLVVVVLMIINVEVNDDLDVKTYGGIIIALTIVYMFASFVYSTVVFIWFYHKWRQQAGWQ